MLPVIDVDVELALDNVVDQNASLNTDLITFTVPVCFISNWDTIPSVMIHMSQSLTDASYDSLGKNVRLLIQMMMVCVRVVEASDWHLYHAHSLQLWHLHWTHHDRSRDVFVHKSFFQHLIK